LPHPFISCLLEREKFGFGGRLEKGRGSLKAFRTRLKKKGQIEARKKGDRCPWTIALQACGSSNHGQRKKNEMESAKELGEDKKHGQLGKA